MTTISTLKALWKKLRINGQVKNYSSKALWILETDSGKPVAHILSPGMKSPPQIDSDAFKRYDTMAIDGHKSWWKFYDFSTVDVYDDGNKTRISVIKKLAVNDEAPDWSLPLSIITDVRRDHSKTIVAYHISHLGWVSHNKTLEMVCRGEIDNGRPVFPKSGRPYIRTKRDKVFINNISIKGKLA